MSRLKQIISTVQNIYKGISKDDILENYERFIEVEI